MPVLSQLLINPLFCLSIVLSGCKMSKHSSGNDLNSMNISSAGQMVSNFEIIIESLKYWACDHLLATVFLSILVSMALVPCLLTITCVIFSLFVALCSIVFVEGAVFVFGSFFMLFFVGVALAAACFGTVSVAIFLQFYSFLYPNSPSESNKS